MPLGVGYIIPVGSGSAGLGKSGSCLYQSCNDGLSQLLQQCYVRFTQCIGGSIKVDELETALRALIDAFGVDAVVDAVSEIADELDPLPDNILSCFFPVMH